MGPIIRVDLRLAPSKLHVVDALARLAVAARDRGEELSCEGAGDDLRALIELAGLTEALRLEPRR
jgi:hypothetical protein